MTSQWRWQVFKQSKKFKAPLFVILLFFISLIIRSHAINDTIRGSHAWLTAHTVLTLQIWFDEGLAQHHFSPVYTFDNVLDKNMRTLASGIPDQEGNYYYVSYPPFSFLLAFFLLKLLNIYPSIFALQIINLTIHLLTTWTIYASICRLQQKKIFSDIWPPALVGSIIYLFSMHPLWCHAYVYFADTLIQLLWAVGIYLAIELFIYEKVSQWPIVFLFAGLLFISIYTEWLGLFFAATTFCLAVWYSIKNKLYLRLVFTISGATIIALGLYILQYGSINDMDTFIQASFSKYFERSGYEKNSLYLTQVNLQHVYRHYLRLYYPQLAIIIFLALASIINYKTTPKPKDNKKTITILGLLLTPVLIHHTVFLGFTRVHDFALLKFAIFAAFFIAILYRRSTFYTKESQRKFTSIFASTLIGAMLTMGLVSYFDFIDRSENTIFESVGEVIVQTAHKDEALFLITEHDKENKIMIFMGEKRAVSPQIQLIAGRNVLGVADKSAALRHMEEFDKAKGRIYTLDINGFVINIEAISLP